MGCAKCGGDESQYCDDCKEEYDKLNSKSEITLKDINDNLIIIITQLDDLIQLIRDN